MNKKKLILPIIATGTLAIVGYFIYDSYLYVHCDNAQIETRVVMLASKVSGFVTETKADIGDHVKAGDILAKIDDRDYVNALERAKAELDSNNARLQDAQKNNNRLSSLYSKGAATQAQFDTTSAGLSELKARFHSLNTQLTMAQLNLDATAIKAPFDGVVAKRAAEVGQYVNSATPLFGFVDANDRWIMANIKETEVDGLEIGSKVDIKIDAISHRDFTGQIQQFSPSTGATFTLIPPDNATGNFTKVVQRVPVRISINGLNPDDIKDLRAGLSATIKIHRRK